MTKQIEQVAVDTPRSATRNPSSVTAFRPARFHLEPAVLRPTEAIRLGRAAAVQRLSLSLITRDVVKKKKKKLHAASNSLKLSSWMGAQDTRRVVRTTIEREQTGSGSSYATANFSECLPVYWDAAALKETRVSE